MAGGIQDIGAQSIVPLLRLEPGHTFLDLCAAPGNKTAQALETGIDAIAADLHFHRASHLKSLGVPVVVLDGTATLPPFKRQPDHFLLVDVPCSGTGTWLAIPQDQVEAYTRGSPQSWNATSFSYVLLALR